MPRFPGSLVLVGAGRMGGALLGGWLKLDVGAGAGAIVVVDPAPSTAAIELCARHNVHLNPVRVSAPDVVVLAVKPQSLPSVAGRLAGIVGPQTLLVSILAGKPIAELRKYFPAAAAVVRAMPNTPAEVGRGITGAVASADVTDAQRELATAIFGAVGSLEWLDDETLMDAVTALSGSGPAYVFHLVECLANAGAAAGLPAGIAMRLARATVEGSAELMARSPALSASVLREHVTSPGGTTAAALAVLMAKDGMGEILRRAVAAAKQRAAELSG